LTFDLDGEAVWTSKIAQDPAFGSATVRSMGRFGPATAMPRILDLLEQYGVRAGFFVVGKVAEEYPDLVREVHRRGHEVAHHSYTHTSPVRLGPEGTRLDFEKCQEVLTRITGMRPRGFRSPAADVTDACWKFLFAREFSYDSSLMTRELPYVCGAHGKSLVEIPFHWLFDDWVHFGFNMYPSLPYMSGISSQQKVYEIWSEEFDGIYDAGLLCTIVMHPQVIGRLSRMRMLARLIEHMQSREAVWFATPYEVATYWKEQHAGQVDEIVNGAPFGPSGE
jgi:peptidoglycan/xylan/chitin deacetylase (PgdA/CDA1 family)